MTTARSLWGFFLLAVAFGPVAAGAWALRRRLLADWHGAIARLVEIVIGLSTTLVTVQVLGVAHLYKVAPVVIGLAIVGGVELWLANDRRLRPSASLARVGGAPVDSEIDAGGDGRFTGGSACPAPS